MDQQKFWDFKSRIDFFAVLPAKVFKTFRYDFTRDFVFIGDTSKHLKDPIPGIQPLLKSSYCALLKIRSLALKGLTRNYCQANIQAFLDWMVNDLDQLRATGYKLAANIFSGNTALRKMIALDSKPAMVIKILMGTCWDIFHAKNTSNSFRLFELLHRNICPYFLTSDANLFSLFQGFSLTLIKDGGEEFVSSFILNSDWEVPDLGDDFIKSMNSQMVDLFIARRNQVFDLDETRLDVLAHHLEKENGLVKG